MEQRTEMLRQMKLTNRDRAKEVSLMCTKQHHYSEQSLLAVYVSASLPQKTSSVFATFHPSGPVPDCPPSRFSQSLSGGWSKVSTTSDIF